jgi:hypothetical protein
MFLGNVGAKIPHPQKHCVFTIFHSKSFFKKSKLDIYKCPILEMLNTFGKSNVCDHNEKLASGDRKKIKKIVTLIFLFFGADSLGVFFVGYL